jgi:hypothetical protein
MDAAASTRSQPRSYISLSGGRVDGDETTVGCMAERLVGA